MGGHGGLNILPQKRWNVYNWENRERVKRDEEEAARQQREQEQQDRKRDSKARLDKLRTNRGGGHHHHPRGSQQEETHGDGDGDGDSAVNDTVDGASLASHDQLLDLFKEDEQGESNKRRRLEPKKMVKKDDRAGRAITAEDEKYKLGYGSTSNSRPWYMSVSNKDKEEEEELAAKSCKKKTTGSKEKMKKKSVEELRAERLKREEDERAKARSLLRGVSSSRKHYNSSYGNARP